MNPQSHQPHPYDRFAVKVFVFTVLAGMFVAGVYMLTGATTSWSATVTCEGRVMHEGDTCACLTYKGEPRREAYTPAGQAPIRKPPQTPWTSVSQVQQIHVRDLAGMRSDNRRRALTLAAFGALTLLTSGFLTWHLIALARRR